MNENFLLLFKNKLDVENLKWEVNNCLNDSIINKNSLIESVIKYPLSDHKTWKKILKMSNLSIDNINEVLQRYDDLTRNILKDDKKLGYVIKERNVMIAYNSDDIIVQLNNNFINSCYVRTGQVDMFPLLYTLKYNSYNMFFLDRTGPIEYYDSELKDKIETIINKNQNIRQSILEYANKDKKYISYHLIRDYEKGKTNYTILELENYIKHLENDITKILRSRRKIFNQIDSIDLKLKEIDEHNKNIIKEIRKYNIFLEEQQKLKLIEDEKIKTNKTDKFIKTYADIFLEFSKKDNEELIEEYLHNKINDMYKQINNYPKELLEQKESLLNKIEKDIINSYLIAINYYLIMISISLSDNKLESIYEGNLINKAIFNVKEIQELIELINKNLLD